MALITESGTALPRTVKAGTATPQSLSKLIVISKPPPILLHQVIRQPTQIKVFQRRKCSSPATPIEQRRVPVWMVEWTDHWNQRGDVGDGA